MADAKGLLLCLALAACSSSKEAATKADTAQPVDTSVIADVEAPSDATPTDPLDPTKYSGKCAGGPATCDDGNPCTVDDCSPLVGCTSVPKACGDDDPCTIDGCDLNNGECTHVADACEDNNACTIGTCTAGEGCTFTLLDCDDGDACTSDGCTPSAGCQKGTVNCDDNKTCTADSCDPLSGCAHVQPPGSVCCEAQAECDDQNICTVNACTAGICVTKPVWGCCKVSADCNDQNPCTVDACDASKGTCSHVFTPSATCCTSDAQCGDGNDCTLDRCVGNLCAHETHCCQKTADCDAASACAEGTCTAAGCALAPVSSSACCKPQVNATGFESAAGWPVTLVPGTQGQWALQPSADAKDGGSLLAYQSASTPILGGAPLAQARLGEIKLPAGTRVALNFWYRWQPSGGDSLRLRIATSLGTWTVWQATSTASWQQAKVDLTGFAGRPATVQARLSFELQQGVVAPIASIDAVSLTSTCGAATCSSSADCNDNLAATAESCGGGLCVFQIGSLYCEPGDACADTNVCTNDSCLNSQCTHTPKPNCCLSTADCDDSNPCSTDYCSGSQCQHIKAPGSVCCASVADCNDSNVCSIDSCPVVGMPCAHTVTDANCCMSALECGDGINCTIDSCKANQCQHKNECCSADLDCADGDVLCTNDVCISGMCQHKPTGMPGCCTTDMQTFDFEGSLPDFLTLSAGSTAVKWQLVSGKKAHGGIGALYYGDISKGNFDNGAPNNGTITTQAIALPQGEALELGFWLYMDTEGSTSYDKFTVTAKTASKSYEVWNKNAPGFATASWYHAVVNLSAFGGQSVTLILTFDTGDSIANSTEGVYVDDFALHRSCSAGSCSSSADCDDKQSASTDACVSGLCTYILP